MFTSLDSSVFAPNVAQSEFCASDPAEYTPSILLEPVNTEPVCISLLTDTMLPSSDNSSTDCFVSMSNWNIQKHCISALDSVGQDLVAEPSVF